MSGPVDYDDFDDDELLLELQAAGRLDPVPPESVAAAKAAFLWRTIDAELAELTYDSLLEDHPLAGVRSTASPTRFLSFVAESTELTVEIQAINLGEGLRLIGQLVPPQGGVVEVRQAGGSVRLEADKLGRFTTDDLVPGPVSLWCRADSGATVATDWVLV